jgi:hypothetical protein
MMIDIFEIKPASIEDVPLILSFIKELAEYEKLLHEVVATEDILKETLFGNHAHAESLSVILMVCRLALHSTSITLRHYDKLILFCIEPSALIDNNRMEEKLKILIRGRKTAHSYKTVNGAGVANVLISLIATAYGADENVYDYLVALQKHKQHVKQEPVAWLPWNYKKTLDAIESMSKNKGQ